MKRIICLALFIMAGSAMVSAQPANMKKDPCGKWTFEAPYAPEGYRMGTIEIVFSESKYHASMAFSVIEEKFPGNNVKFEKDSLSFNVFIDNQNVAVSLVLTEEAKMTGKAVYSEGIVPLALTREMKKE